MPQQSSRDAQIDRSLTRLYVLYRASLGACSAADIVSGLEGRGVRLSRVSAARFLLGLESKAYVVAINASSGPKTFRVTSRALRAVQQLGKVLRFLGEENGRSHSDVRTNNERAKRKCRNRSTRLAESPSE